MVRPTFHTNPSRQTELFENVLQTNAALFLQLGLPSTLIRHKNEAFCLKTLFEPVKFNIAAFSLPFKLIRHENGTFRKRSSNWRNLKTPALRFTVNEKHFENRAFSNAMTSR